MSSGNSRNDGRGVGLVRTRLRRDHGPMDQGRVYLRVAHLPSTVVRIGAAGSRESTGAGRGDDRPLSP